MNRAPVLYLHIGGEKTGTSSIQRTLFKSSARLRSHHGIFYPAQGPVSHRFCHCPILSPFLPTSELDFVPGNRRLDAGQLVAALSQLGSSHENIVLSAEHLSSRLRSLEAISRLAWVLRSALPNHTVKVIFSVRHQTSLFIAAWSAHITGLGIQPPETHTISPLDPLYNHLLTATAWADVFGKQALIIRNYHADDAVDSFLSLLGIDRDVRRLRRIRRANRSLTLEQAEIVRDVNLCFGKPDFEDHRLIVRRLRVVRLLVRHLVENTRLPRTPLSSILAPLDTMRLSELFARSNNELQRDFGLDFNLNDHAMASRDRSSEVSAESRLALDRERAMWVTRAAPAGNGSAEASRVAEYMEAELSALCRRRLARAIPWHPKTALHEMALLQE